MKNIALIPSRLGSSRFPGKPLEKILDKPLIQHVWEGTIKSPLLDLVYVCTCDEEIFNFLKSINANVIMTSKTHTRASDRCAEALIKIEKGLKVSFKNIVMVQGDEPLVNSTMIDQSLKPIIENKTQITNLLGPFHSEDEFKSKNSIKVVINKNNEAMYFSRAVIPFMSNYNEKNVGKQVCVISWKRDMLLKFNNMSETPLEQKESIDMLRLLENDIKVTMVPTDCISQPVDSIEDIKVVEKILLSE